MEGGTGEALCPCHGNGSVGAGGSHRSGCVAEGRPSTTPSTRPSTLAALDPALPWVSLLCGALPTDGTCNPVPPGGIADGSWCQGLASRHAVVDWVQHKPNLSLGQSFFVCDAALFFSLSYVCFSVVFPCFCVVCVCVFYVCVRCVCMSVCLV